MENFMQKIVKATLMAYETDQALRKAGYKDTPYWDIYGSLMDGIFEFTGEKISPDNLFEDSSTYMIMHTVSLSNERRVAMLINERKKNRPAQN